MDNYKQIHKGVIKLGEYELPCYVVDDGNKVERVLTQREVVKLITGGRDSGNLKKYLQSRALVSTLPSEITSDFDVNLLIINVGSYSINGVKAATVVDICNAYLKARQLGLLASNQGKLAEQSEIFISALAKTGIDAIIDEATGYQYFRKANDLQAKLDSYVQDGYREWTRAFPREFFMNLYRLEGMTPPMIDAPYPKRFGKYVMQYVYDTLDPEIADFLRKNNPEPSGKKHHHQKFNDFGHKALLDHLFSILGIAKASVNMKVFKENLAFAFPNHRTRKRARFLENKQQKFKEDNPMQLDLLEDFDFLKTANTPNKLELFDDIDEEKHPEKKEGLSEFNKILKKGLDYNPKENE